MKNEGMPFVKFMMLLGSMAPLFILVGIRGMNEIIDDKWMWVAIFLLLLLPYLVLKQRIKTAIKRKDTFLLDISINKNNKEYLFTYLFTVLLPLYSVSIDDFRSFVAMIFAICFVIFVLWNMNLHFINLLFAFQGYKVFTIESSNSAILLTTRTELPTNIKKIKVHRISNSVFIEIKEINYGS